MRIIFASLGSLGDLHPMLALAKASREGGHSPVIVASEVYRDYVESLGFLFCALRPNLELDPDRVKHLSHPRRGPKRLMREEVFARVRETYDDLLAATEGADFLVVGELLYVAPLVAAKRGIPWANAILAPVAFLSASDPGIFAPVPGIYFLRHFGVWTHRLIFAFGRLETSRWSAPLRTFSKELGLPSAPNPIFDGKHRPISCSRCSRNSSLNPNAIGPLQLCKRISHSSPSRSPRRNSRN